MIQMKAGGVEIQGADRVSMSLSIAGVKIRDHEGLDQPADFGGDLMGHQIFALVPGGMRSLRPAKTQMHTTPRRETLPRPRVLQRGYAIISTEFNENVALGPPTRRPPSTSPIDLDPTDPLRI